MARNRRKGAGGRLDCNESLRLRPNDAHTLDSRGFVELKLGQFDKAITDYNAALALAPKSAYSLYGRGLAKLKKGEVNGHQDIDSAKSVQFDVADKFKTYGLQ